MIIDPTLQGRNPWAPDILTPVMLVTCLAAELTRVIYHQAIRHWSQQPVLAGLQQHIHLAKR